MVFEEALALWFRAGELLEREDDRFFAPAHRLATEAAQRGEVEVARDLLERALEIRPRKPRDAGPASNLCRSSRRR